MERKTYVLLISQSYLYISTLILKVSDHLTQLRRVLTSAKFSSATAYVIGEKGKGLFLSDVLGEFTYSV